MPPTLLTSMQNGTPGSFRPRVTHVVSQMVKKGEVHLPYTLWNYQPQNYVCQQSLPEHACISFCLLPCAVLWPFAQHGHLEFIAGCCDGSFLTIPGWRFRAGLQLGCLCCSRWSQWLCSSAALSGSTLQGADATHANQTSSYCSWH